MIEGSGSGSRDGSAPLTYGSGSKSRRPKTNGSGSATLDITLDFSAKISDIKSIPSQK